MRQEINLYTKEFMPQRLWCSFKHMVCVVILGAVLMAHSSFQQYMNIKVLKEDHQNLLAKTATLENTDIDNLMDRLVDKRQRIERQISALSGEIEQKKKIKRVYEEKQNTVFISFHQMFRDISLKSNANIAISEVGIYQGGVETILSGVARKRENIPDYLTQLKGTQAFSSTQFGLLVIKRVQSQGIYEFSMSRKDTDPYAELIDQYSYRDSQSEGNYEVR